MDVFNAEEVELAATRAERAVHPFLAGRAEPFFAGASIVVLTFLDVGAATSFRRIGSISRKATESGWPLVRRWAHANGDGGLDERMCSVVAAHLNESHRGLLRASVVTWVR